ncbi:MAG: TatD family hydrolase [Proteobacteria bacterium]|nr:TatD family hydrolase [Pseudomonadota bacterium]MBU1648303.1 TatD family hydrolase [Pseudomonadota bacterium]
MASAKNRHGGFSVNIEPGQLPQLTHDTFLIDSHCHLDMDAYQDDLETILEQAYQNNIRTIISVGIDEKSSRQAIFLAAKYTMVKATIGIHPHDVAHIQPQTFDILADLAEKNSKDIVGYGEIGLDYVKNYTPADIQRTHFRSQLSLANELKLPVIIHDREAHDDILRILREAAPYKYGGVMHCFSGNMTLARQVLDLGFHISIPGVVTFKNATDLQKVAREAPLTSLLLETDGPFLSPVPQRGKRNEPTFLLYTAQMIADLRDIPINEVARQTSANAMRLFRLPPTLMT